MIKLRCCKGESLREFKKSSKQKYFLSLGTTWNVNYDPKINNAGVPDSDAPPHKCAPPGHLSLGSAAPLWAQMPPSQELVLLFSMEQTFFYSC